ncbi:MAG: hypothetical protein ACK4GT_00305 [Pararhodobacter sp.]
MFNNRMAIISASAIAAMAGLTGSMRSANIAVDELKTAMLKKRHHRRPTRQIAETASTTTARNRMPHQGEREKARRRRQLAAGQIHFIKHGPVARGQS